ncbi:CorA family divalent cation transporter [Microbispora bryophytorum]|uniref:CorA family divalent cation transporter n=1 Tax=Microbispora bryophytorum TaxID=1460882 RepID=UPI003405B28D
MDVHLINHEGIEERPVEELPTLLGRQDGLVWVDIPRCDTDAVGVLTEVFGYHPMAINDCVERNRVPKMHAYRDHVFVVVHAPERGKRGHVHYIELDQFIGRNYLVTLHGPVNPAVQPGIALRETQVVLARIEAGRLRPASAFELSHAIVAALIRNQEDYVEADTGDVWRLEQRVTGGQVGDPEEFLERKLRELSADDVDRWLATKAKTLSTETLRKIHSILKRSIARAQARDKVKRNVVMLCEIPKGREGRPSKSLTLDQAASVLKAAEGAILHAYVVVSLPIGARTEELRALTWAHVSLDGQPDADPSIPPSITVWRSVRIGGDTKTEKSRRTLTLPRLCMDALRGHCERQALARKKAGDLWQENDLVFASKHGTELDSANVRRAFRVILKKTAISTRTTGHLGRCDTASSRCSPTPAWRYLPPGRPQGDRGHRPVTHRAVLSPPTQTGCPDNAAR